MIASFLVPIPRKKERQYQHLNMKLNQLGAGSTVVTAIANDPPASMKSIALDIASAATGLATAKPLTYSAQAQSR